MKIMKKVCVVLTMVMFLTIAFATCENLTVQDYTVTFDSKGGSTVSAQTVPKGEAIGAEPETTKEGYTFGGWYASSIFSGDKIVFPYTPAKNIKLYAKWDDILCDIDSVTLNETARTMTIDETFDLIATVVADPDEADNKKVTWSSSKINVVTVDLNGKITAKTAGSSTITATSTKDNSKKATCEITVYDLASGLVYKNAGTYEVGKDINAGEYLLVSTTTGYLQVTLTKDASVLSSDFLYNNIFSGRRYVKITDGQFLQFSGSRLYKLESAPALTAETDKGYKAGQYKAGLDLEVGEYIIVDSSFASNYIEQLKSPNASISSSDFLFNEIFEYRHYVKIETGDYISFSSGRLYKLIDAPAIIKNADGSFRPGQYKIGENADIPAGQYGFIVPIGGTVYYEITTLPLCSIASSAFIKNAILSANANVNFQGGQYIQFDNGKLEYKPL